MPKEIAEGERRVALVPDTVAKLVEDEHEVVVQAGAGRDSYPDADYAKAGARIAEEEPLDGAEIVLKVAAPTGEEVDGIPEGCLLVCFLDPTREEEILGRLADRRVSVFSMASIPRTGAAQAMDAISSMGSLAGYQAVLMAAQAVGRYLPMMTTAAGTTKSAKVLVLGVGVAGLQAIATARRLGAEVEAFDIRPEVADQVRSLGATFIEAGDDADEADEAPEDGGPEVGRTEAFVKALLGLPRDFGRRRQEPHREEADDAQEAAEQQGGYASEQDEAKQRRDQELMTEHLAEMDVVLTTALVPGKQAPTLVSAEMVERMKPGAVLFDLAAEAGGNCELSKAGEVVVHEHVRIYAPLNLPSTMPIHASHLLSRNVASVLAHLIDDEGKLQLDFDDEITAGAVLAHDGEVREQ